MGAHHEADNFVHAMWDRITRFRSEHARVWHRSAAAPAVGTHRCTPIPAADLLARAALARGGAK